MIAGPTKSRKLVGDNQTFNLDEGSDLSYVVIGNNNQVTIKANAISLKIVGNSNEVQVLSGNGRISYVGNNGRIKLGEMIGKDLVNYVGDNGRIYQNGEIFKLNSKQTRIRSCNGVKIQTHSSSGITFSRHLDINVDLPGITVHIVNSSAKAK